MKIIAGIVAAVFFLILLDRRNEKNRRKEEIKILREEWGKKPQTAYTEEKFNSLISYYYSKQKEGDIDDITWNDLDMNLIFQQINNTSSAIGEEYLYSLLRQPLLSEKVLKERDRLMNLFESREEKRITLQHHLKQMGKFKNASVYQYIQKLAEEKQGKNFIHYIQGFLLIFSACLLPFHVFWIAVFFFIMGWNIYSYFKEKAEKGPYFLVCAYVGKMIAFAEKAGAVNMDGLEFYNQRFRDIAGKLKKIKKYSFWLAGGENVSGGLENLLLDYVRMLFHIDLIKYNNMIGTISLYKKEWEELFDLIGLLDSMMAGASFRKLKSVHTVPELSLGKKPFLSADSLYHPLIQNPVPSSISEEHCVLLTGSNASGKSTFLKTTAVNAILAQTLYTALARKYHASYFHIYSSMALRDSMMSSESYYIVEIKALKRILDKAEEDIPVLCFVDEVLRGTNTLERVAASSRILKYLSEKNALCFAATHDGELTYILKNCYKNYHFEEKLEEGRITFDYILHKGKASSKNAILLLESLGYPDVITKDAKKAAEEFKINNQWHTIRQI